MYFRAGVNAVTFTVTIRDERLIEPAEEFYIDLEIPSSAAKRGVIKDSPSTVTVTIVNDDGECSSSALCTTVNTQTEHSDSPYRSLSDNSYCAVSICPLD